MTNGLVLLALGALVIAWSVMIFMTFETLEYYRKRKLLRCPETGGIAFLEIEGETESLLAVVGRGRSVELEEELRLTEPPANGLPRLPALAQPRHQEPRG